MPYKLCFTISETGKEYIIDNLEFTTRNEAKEIKEEIMESGFKELIKDKELAKKLKKGEYSTNGLFVMETVELEEE